MKTGNIESLYDVDLRAMFDLEMPLCLSDNMNGIIGPPPTRRTRPRPIERCHASIGLSRSVILYSGKNV